MPPADDGATETTYYPNGGIKFTGGYVDGEMHGEWRWYRTDGSLMRTGAFDRGRQVGVWRTYDRAGHVVKETAFSRDGSRA
jgi:antitoxin component YwqK of YwqJK toxin-antitoxin module